MVGDRAWACVQPESDMAREPLYQSTRSADDEDRDLRPQRMQDMVGQRGAVLGHDRLTRVDDLPVEVDTGRVQHAAGCLRQLWTDAIAGDAGD